MHDETIAIHRSRKPGVHSAGDRDRPPRGWTSPSPGGDAISMNDQTWVRDVRRWRRDRSTSGHAAPLCASRPSVRSRS